MIEALSSTKAFCGAAVVGPVADFRVPAPQEGKEVGP
jgi:hypothetical protein